MTRTDRRTLLQRLGVAAVATLPLAGCTSSSTTPTEGGSGETTDGSGASTEWKQTSTVEMTADLVFAPERIEVPKGTEVTWKTTGSIGHTVTAYEEEIPEGASYFASGGFDSQQAAEDGYSDGQEGNVAGGESYSHTFETTGTYKYYCIPHELNGMVGYVRVV